ARDLHGLPVTEFIPQVAESGLLDLFRRVATTGEPVTISEFEFTGFERGDTYWDWSMVSLHDTEGGPVTGLLLLVAERTEAVLARRRLAAALAGARAQAAELDAVIQQMAEGVAITDPSGRLIKINAAGEALLGRGIVPLEPGGNYAEGYEIYDREGRPFDPARLPLERAARGETVTGQDMVVHRPGGEECILSVSAAPLHGEAGTIQGAVAVFHDVTKAREVERLKDEFLSIVSHELRTPLAAILGYSDILLRKLSGPLTEKQEQTIESVRSNAKRLLGLINDLLDVSKLEAQGITLSPEPLLLQHAIPKAQGWVQVLATARGVSLQHQVPVTLPAVWADEARLHQIITNLLSNAIKFTPTGGAVMVRAQLSTLPADAPAEQAESALAPTEGPSVLITVQDTGLGMAPDQLERIWDRFYQAESTSSRRFGGTGLGLSIVKHLVALHGGEVWATSGGPDKGSTFSFRLPLVSSDSRPRTRAPEEPASEVPSDAPPAEPSAPGRPLVLIIEDHHDLSTVMRTMLDAAGYQVATAGDGSSGLEAAHRLQPAVIMLDVVLPQASGWEVLQQLKSEPTTTKIPVVMVSILEHQRLGLLLGATEYLVKPFDQERLVATLRRLVGPTPRQPRVLIVDDAPALRDTLSTLLREDGYLVDTANDGVLALEQLRVAPPDLVLLDLVMPGMDGFAVLEWIRAHGDPAIHNLPVVMVTAKDLTPEEHARLAAATEELIPVAGMSIGELLRVVKETLEKLHVTAHDDHPGA
ncbi:MAG TPA: response regulator, partial [Chloroflexia bacterium]|nr:response regulator [Chloroflexia bacterium]